MPKRTDIHSILIIGSGPIVIGQGCEFDYSGVQACRALREEGYRIVLINSNPATIMTDPQFADATYIEPISPEAVEKILAREKAQGTPVDAILPTLGGQTGLNVGMACFDQGILTKYGVKMIGADRDAIHRGEDRQVFKDLMIQIGLKVPRSGVVHNMDDARKVLADIGLPLIIRPAFTLGGTGGGIAYNVDEFETIVARGLDASPVTEVLIEESVIGWKEFELEVVRDKNDNCIIVCSIENIDPMGVHTGDSITVAPIQTLTDKEYQRMRDAAFAVIRAVGVETGGSNIQFATNPENGDMVVVEMNPRVSRSSALASKATGYPIAKIAAKLAVGYTLDELPNPITSRKRSGCLSSAEAATDSDWELFTSACFEPTIDYCVIKIPRFTFEKFPDADETLTTQMKSVGEAMAIGRTFKEALQKGIRSMEVKRFGFGLDSQDAWLKAQETSSRGTGLQPVQHSSEHGLKTHATAEWPIADDLLRSKLSVPNQNRLYYLRYALKMGWTIDQIHELTKIDRWFLAEMKQLTDFENELAEIEKTSPKFVDPKCSQSEKCGEYSGLIKWGKRLGYSDMQMAAAWSDTPGQFRRVREWFTKPVYKLVDTCAAEFEAATPYYYSTYETPFVTVGSAPRADPPLTVRDADPTTTTVLATTEDEIRLTDRPKIIIIGGGPNRIGQGIEFDYCCVQAAFALKELGIESVMINSNPETVSTDYDTSDLLFFEPLTHEDVLNVCERLNGRSFSLEVDDLTLDEDGHSLMYVGGKETPPPGISANWKSVVAAQAKHRGLGSLGLVQVGVAGDIRSLSMVDARRALWSFDFSQATSTLVEVHPDPTADWMWANVIDSKTATRVDQFVARQQNLVQGVIVQFGGQTPLNLARSLHDVGVPIVGTSIDMLEAAGDREKFRTLVEQVGLKQPENGIARSVEDARQIAAKIGYPVLVRPSFVLGGRAMEIVSDEGQLNHYMAIAVKAEGDNPILVDKFLDHAIECDVDCIADYRPLSPVPGSEGRGEGPSAASSVPSRRSGTESPSPQPFLPRTGEKVHVGRSVICGVMEHIEEAGIHSGDSACALPPYSFSPELVQRLKDNTHKLAAALKVNGLMNVQYAIKDDEIYLIEVNPRASRTIPFVGKATGVPWAKLAAKVMAGKTLDELNVHELPDPKHVSVKEVVFPFSKFPGVDVILGPEMRSTGEVMGIDVNFARAYGKAQIAASNSLPLKGRVYVSVNDRDKKNILPIARQLSGLGFTILVSAGTGKTLAAEKIPCEIVPKLSEGRPNIIDRIKNGDVQLIINTPTRKGRGTDEAKIRGAAVMNRVPIVTTLTGAHAATLAISELQKQDWTVQPLQAYFSQSVELASKLID